MAKQIPTFSIEFDGPIILIGFGSVGRGLLPLIDRHIRTLAGNITVIDPREKNKTIAEKYGANFVHLGLTEDNYCAILDTLITDKSKKTFIVSVCNEVSSEALAEYAALNNCFYIDTVVEPWPGFYFKTESTTSEESNYALREGFLNLKNTYQNTPTAISCCGANPGMVSWLVKEALLNLANDLGKAVLTPQTKNDWAKLMFDLGVKGIHISERDTQMGDSVRPKNYFINTWSPEGCQAELLQPSELGWGTHENNLPKDAVLHDFGNKSSICLNTHSGEVKVRTWTPTEGAHFGYLITHNESISISDYFTYREHDKILYRPTCHYAYHPCNTTIESISELFEERNKKPQSDVAILEEDQIISGADELGVLLYGHERGAYWYGSRLTIEETKELAPHQNATGLQVTSAILAGMFYAIKNPNLGIIEVDEMNFEDCLEIQKPYLGKVFGEYTNWSPHDEINLPPTVDPWQFENIRITEPKL